MSEVEKLAKAISALAAKKVDFEKKQATNRQRMAEVKFRRSELVLTAADGDEAAKREKRELDHQHHDLLDADETLLAALADINGKIETRTRELARAERAAVIAQLESEIRGLDALDVKVGAAIRDLKAATAGLFAACGVVAAELQKMDPHRFDGSYAFKLRADIRDAIMRAVVNVDQPAVAESFIEAARIKLRGGCAQLAFEALEGRIPLAKGEKLYRTCGHVNLRDVQLPPGSVIGLRPDEAAEFIRVAGEGWLVEEPEAAA